MGEISEMMLEGTLCQECGGFVGEKKMKQNGARFRGSNIIEVPGFPLYCEDCEPRPRKRKLESSREGKRQ